MRRLAAPPALWLLAFLVVPSGVVTAAAFSREGLHHLVAATTWTLVARTAWMSAVATALCLAIGYPAAWFIATSPPRRRALLLFLIVIPFWTNLLVRVYSLQTLLRPLGMAHSTAAVLLGLVHVYLPFMILPLVASIEKVPARLLEAAADLGASPWAAFARVALPLTLPGIAAGCILVFIPALGSFAIPELLGRPGDRMIGSQIDLHFRQRNEAAGSALTLLLLAATLGLTCLFHRVRRSEGLV